MELQKYILYLPKFCVRTRQKVKIRIKDIAERAGVSEGTVDRVLHNRGEVSARSRERVLRVMKEIDYSPNLLARSLASKRTYRCACIIPEHKPRGYWASVERGFDMAAEEFAQYNMVLEKFYFNQFDVVSFHNIISQVIDLQPDAVALAPIFKEETILFTSELAKCEIAFSFIDSMIEETDFLTYYGQNSFKSGLIAAKLLLAGLPQNAAVLVIRTKRTGAGANQTQARVNGFLNYIAENQLSNIKLKFVELTDSDENANRQKIRKAFEEEQNIVAAITFNSKVYAIAQHIEKQKGGDIRIVGYDLTDENIACLKNGTVHYLVAQRPEKQSYKTIRDICRKIIFRQEIRKINFVPIDIIIKENVDDYVSYGE